MTLPAIMAELSTTTGLTFEPSPWFIGREQLWHAHTPDGMNVSVLPTRAAVMLSNQLGAFYHPSSSASLDDIATTIAFALIAARFDAPTRSPWRVTLSRLRGSQPRF